MTTRQTPGSLPHQALSGLSLSLAFALSLALIGQAVEAAAPDTARALKTLMGPDAANQAQGASTAGGPSLAQPPIPSMAPMGTQPPMPVSPAPLMASGQAGLVMVKPGDTLAKILDRSMGRPFDRKTVFQAMVALNPHAFIMGNPNRLVANVPLRVPNAQQMAGLLSGQLTPAALAAQMNGQSGAGVSGGSDGRAQANMTVDPHKGWPRYPSR